MKKTEDYFLNCHTEDSVKIRYRLLSKQYHPDANPEDPEGAKKTFQEVLNQRDKTLRSIYRKAGITEEQIDERFKDFIDNFFLDPLNADITAIAKMMGQEIEETNPEASFGDIFSSVLGKMLKASGLDEKNLTPEQKEEIKKLTGGK